MTIDGVPVAELAKQKSDRLLRRRAVEEKTGLSRATIWRLIAAGRFPKPVRFTPGRLGLWVESEIDAYIAGLIAGRDAAA